jgi:acyl-CoA synthetase (AMP-forming)/AMP-acid ligase II
MQNYYRRAREECFDDDGWFHTGDLVRTDTDGLFYFIGRHGAMIKSAGANVAPAEVERAIAKVTGKVSYVVGLPDPQRGQLVAAVVVSDHLVDETVLAAELRSQLSAYKIPKRFVTLPASRVPLMSSGKVDVNELKRVFDADH